MGTFDLQQAGEQTGAQVAGHATGQVLTTGGGGGGGSNGAPQAGTEHAGIAGQAVTMVHPGTACASSGV